MPLRIEASIVSTQDRPLHSKSGPGNRLTWALLLDVEMPVTASRTNPYSWKCWCARMSVYSWWDTRSPVSCETPTHTHTHTLGVLIISHQ